jgi:tetratricopeptide (TPR) repeat protein
VATSASQVNGELGSIDAALAHAAHCAVDRPRLALDQVDEILRVTPGHPQALLIRGRAQRLAGDPAAACATLHALADAQPRSAATAHELGLALHAADDDAGAVAWLRRAVALKPDLAEAWIALADLLRASGEEAEADRAYLSGVGASKRDPLLAQAAIALLDGKLAIAEQALRSRLRERPTDVAAIRMMAELAIRVGRLEDGIKLLGRALDLAPGFAAARELLARTLQRQNRSAEAMTQVDALLASDPRNPSLAMLKASLLVRVGDQAGAAAVYAETLARHPQQAKAWMSYAHVLKTIGRLDDAIAAYREALARRATLGEVWWSLANLKTYRFTAADVAAMQAALAQTYDVDDRLHLHFALGKAHEDAGKDAAAFAAYAEGNRIRHGQLGYDADDTHDQCVREAALSTPAFLATRTGGGCPAPDPIFVVGLPRSGSTLIEQILASHSMIEGTAELPDLMAIAARLAGRRAGGEAARYPELLADLTPVQRTALGEEYLARTRVNRREGKPFFIDKMPNNWMHVGLIRLILPNAKIVDARRHPLGCGWSAYKQHFSRGQAFSYDLGALGRYYRDYVTAMAHIDRVMPGHVHRVIYEAMVADTEAEVRALLDHLGVPFEAGCLAFHRNDRAVRTPSSEQVRQPIFADAVDHWRRFDPWLASLRDALGPVLDAYPAAPAGISFTDDGQKTRAVSQGREEPKEKSS